MAVAALACGCATATNVDEFIDGGQNAGTGASSSGGTGASSSGGRSSGGTGTGGTSTGGTSTGGTGSGGINSGGTATGGSATGGSPTGGTGGVGTPTCTDGVKNGDETDVDCGGSCSNKCAVGKGCGTATDCAQDRKR